MEEDGGVKAPVTRLRRRLSLELSDDTKSPSAPSTPTKKRAGRLASKPQLELIDENVPQNSPKLATRKSIARDLADPEERAVTPSRRSTRIKSNTSIVSETTQSFDSPRAKRAAARRNSQIGSDNEAPVTPARTLRTRRDSTSSLDKQGKLELRVMLDSSVSLDKQAIPTSVTEIPTPGKTRRTRKDSASSIDKQDETVATNKQLITEVITEEPEINLRKSTSSTDIDEVASSQKSSPGSLRKSPRLTAKKGRKSNSSRSESINNQSQDTNGQIDNNIEKPEPDSNLSRNKSESNDVEKDKLSVSSANLINVMDIEPKIKKNSLNKSASSVTVATEFKNKRHRTKSLTTLSVTEPIEDNFYSDNESFKKKMGKPVKIFTVERTKKLTDKPVKKTKKLIEKPVKVFTIKRLSYHTGSGDGPQNAEEVDQLDNLLDEKKISLNGLNSSSKKNKRSETGKNTSVNESTSSKTDLIQSNTGTPKGKENVTGSENESNKENLFGENAKSLDSNETELLYEKAPIGIIKSLVYFEDSDTETALKAEKEIELSGSNQLAPDVYQESSKKPADDDFTILNVEEKLTNSDTCEPMDIDETMPEHVSLTDCSNGNKLEESSRKSSISFAKEEENNAIESANKSKRKSSISHSMLHDFEKSGNDNKSTLILSQIKDVSCTENNVSKSPRKSNNETLSKSMTIPDVAKDGLINKNISLNYLTSTPEHQKDIKISAVEINTSVITPNSTNKKDIRIRDSITKSNKKEVSVISKSLEYDSTKEESEQESSNDSNDMLDDEAEDAGDDYQSGDSQDEEERRYEEENEILVRGETLDSDDEVSNDSDYEKDSFLVSSDEEDRDLLSGSGDDLGMSDNELTMSFKSKEKYNERKQKIQKKASREMFEARHKLNESDKNSKSVVRKPKKNNRLRLDSTLLDSGDDNKELPKKNKRMRLDSSTTKSDPEESHKKDSNMNKTDSEEVGYKKKKSKRLSESMYDDSAINEKEITVVDDNMEHDDPLSVKVKPEPKTPQKDLSLSKVNFTCMEEVEQVQVEENVSIMMAPDTHDPLQATVAEEDSDMSSISENEEITNNYESLLAHLNNENKAKNIKSFDNSLNLNKKAKKKADNPIVDELNLTQIKSKTKKPKVTEPQKIKEKFGNQNEEASSDSIDLKLLFSDDSNEGAMKKDNDRYGNVENIIPLKRTEGKTNLRKSLNDSDITENVNVLNVSNKKKNKKRNTNQNEDNTTASGGDGDNANFFIDTTGTHVDLEIAADVSLNTSTKKKNKKNSISFHVETDKDKEPTDSADFDDTPAEVSYQSSKNKKVKKIKENSEEDIEKSTNISAMNTPASEKKKKKQTSVSQDEVDSEVLSTSMINNVSMNKSKLKNHNFALEVSMSEKSFQDDRDDSEVTERVISNKRKNKKLHKTLNEDKSTGGVNGCGENFFIDITGTNAELDDSANVSHNTSLKKKNKKTSISTNIEPVKDKETTDPVEFDETPAEVSYQISMNKKVNKSIEEIKEKSIKISVEIDSEENKANDFEETITSAKKRKRMSSANQESAISDTSKVLNTSKYFLETNESSESQKKKRKISHNHDDGNSHSQDILADTTPNAQHTLYKPEQSNLKKLKKGKKIDSVDEKQDAILEPVIKVTKETEKIIANQKRKERDDDDSGKISKVLKQNSCDKIHVPRLPPTIINQLDEKSRKDILEMKKSVVSTTEFVVEESRKRKAKPSNYLEESVYLNDDESPESKKQKPVIKKPKVLPFIPTASTSDSGFTTNFQVSVIPDKIEFVARGPDVAHFKNDYLQTKKIKKLHTYDLYRKHRNVKLSKF